MDSRLKIRVDLAEVLAFVAVESGRKAHQKLRRKKRGAYRTLRPGNETPVWNACAALLREELRPRGAKVRLARYLGIPKQRVTDFVTNGSRMPDAEILLKMLAWLARKRSGEDLSL